ncbi:hypothetical protein BJX76DRAFT_361824 [Aspergillus varians]
MKRVSINPETGLPFFPSWSWAGWTGPVQFENWNKTNGVPDLEERSRRAIPLASMALDGSETVHSFKPGQNGVELSDGWSETLSPNDGICYLWGHDRERYHSVPIMYTGCTTSRDTREVQGTGLTFVARTQRFRLTYFSRHAVTERTPWIERKCRFGLARVPGDDDRWIGTILLPIEYNRKLDGPYESILLSKSYCVRPWEIDHPADAEVQPYAVCEVMMMRRVEGEQLRKYQNHLWSRQVRAAEPPPIHIVERVGVGRMYLSEWDAPVAEAELTLL